MRFSSYGRLVTLAALIFAAPLLFVASSAAEHARIHAMKPVCTHGVSSIGPVYLRGGIIVAGNMTPRTEACLH